MQNKTNKIHVSTSVVFMRLQLFGPGLINQLLPLSRQWIDINLQHTLNIPFHN